MSAVFCELLLVPKRGGAIRVRNSYTDSKGDKMKGKNRV
jgi:hypothetical protein